MAQIVVRAVDDHLMQAFKERAKRQGKSAEQAVRELIERAVREAEGEAEWFARVADFRARIARKYGEAGDR